MTPMNMIAVGVIFVFAAAIIGIRLYKNRNEKFDMDTFIDTYGDNIIEALQDAILILKINMDEFDSMDEYEKAIIRTTINSLKESASRFGIPDNMIKLIDTESLTSIIADCFNQNKFDCLGILSTSTMEAHEEIIDPYILRTSRAKTENNHESN